MNTLKEICEGLSSGPVGDEVCGLTLHQQYGNSDAAGCTHVALGPLLTQKMQKT